MTNPRELADAWESAPDEDAHTLLLNAGNAMADYLYAQADAADAVAAGVTDEQLRKIGLSAGSAVHATELGWPDQQHAYARALLATYATPLAAEKQKYENLWSSGIDKQLSLIEQLATANSRVSELEQRLEIQPGNPYDGIDTRDRTIKELDQQWANSQGQALIAAATLADQVASNLYDEYDRSHDVKHCASAVCAEQIAAAIRDLGRKEGV